jgi:hypothetical protein
MSVSPYELLKLPHKRLEKRLVASGRSGQAEVLEAAIPRTYMTSGITYDDDMLVPWDLALRVTPETEPPFEVRLRMQIHCRLTLSPGIVFKVLYDPEDHQRMVADPSALPRNDVEASAAYRIGMLSAQGYDTAGLEDQVKSATDLDAAEALIDNAVSDQVAARNNSAMAELLKARRDGTRVAQPPPGFAPDVASRIEQLDRLKQAGLINDEQYRVKRQKLIDQA